LSFFFKYNKSWTFYDVEEWVKVFWGLSPPHCRVVEVLVYKARITTPSLCCNTVNSDQILPSTGATGA
jgi:hypothetical protein